MKILNFGSLNIDKVYEVGNFVQSGETIASLKYSEFCGGKGLNQSIALARAGLEIYHAGKISSDGSMLLDYLKDNGVNVDYIAQNGTCTGHAIIQINKHGENCILLYGGANKEISKDYIDFVLKDFGLNDILILQNEVSHVDYIVDQAHKKGLKIALNPSPIDEAIHSIDLSKICWLILNEIEGKEIGKTLDEEDIINQLLTKYPNLKVILTLGVRGSIYAENDIRIKQDIIKTNVVDTTAAGDTFLGYFLAGVVKKRRYQECLMLAATAASIAVSIKGASVSIPMLRNVDEYIISNQRDTQNYITKDNFASEDNNRVHIQL